MKTIDKERGGDYILSKRLRYLRMIAGLHSTKSKAVFFEEKVNVYFWDKGWC